MNKRIVFILVSFLLSSTAFAGATADQASNPHYLHHWQIGIGPGLISGLNAPDLISSWRIGFGAPVTEDIDLSLITDFGISSQRTDTHFFTIKVAGDYNFTTDNMTPFMTADLGYASVHAHANCSDVTCQSPGDDAGGVALGVGGGYKFWRHQCMQLGVLARYDVMFTTTRYGTPMKYALEGVLYF